jgi:NADPH:quinone reductase-like Zn-dependent oxidoreductase
MNVWNYAFGTLPGWWLGELDGRLDKPNVTTDRWDGELRAAGFTGVDTAVDDAEQPYLYCSALVTRPKRPSNRSEPSREITVLCDSYNGEIVGLLTDTLSSLGYSVSFCELGQVLPLHQQIISTLGLESSFLEDISEPTFLAFQDFLRSHNSQKLLWLALPSQISCRNPRSAQTIGVARKIRSELGIPCFTLEIDPAEPEFADLVLKTFTKVQESEDTENLLPDTEFVVYNGMIHIGRYHPFSTEERRQGTTNAGPDRVKKLDVSKLGSLQGVSWTHETHIEQIQDDEVELKVCAVGLEFALDNIPYSQEVAGMVRRIGSKVENVAVGERVMALWPFDSIATHAVITGCLVAKIPDRLSFEEAASMPASFVTAFRSLLEVGQLTARQSVLIHLAASSLSHAAIAICKAVGAEIYATVDNEEEAAYLTDTYGIANSRIYQAKDDLFAAHLIDDTQGYGTDIILNSRRELLQSSWKCVAKFGKFIDLGSRDLTVLNRFDMQLFLENRSYCCVNLAHLIRELPIDTGR